jgi:competence protein CoiA
MKYALVDGQRQEAEPGRSGVCPACDGPMVARCGNVRVHHWAHRVGAECDRWWEPETQWHRNWKNQFPVEWQEVIHAAENGEKHVADVKTDQGWVLEFQHSAIDPVERQSREAFYKKMLWIVDATRRKRDKPQFIRACEGRTLVVNKAFLARIPVRDESALLRDWAGSPAPVFFDFSGPDQQVAVLWCLYRIINGVAYVGSFARQDLINYHSPEAKKNGLDFSAFLAEFGELLSRSAAHR